MNSKKLAKIHKILGDDLILELNSLSDANLSNLIVSSEQNINKAQEELEQNPKYQELKENLSALTAGFKDVKKHQNAKIQYALSLLESRGKQ